MAVVVCMRSELESQANVVKSKPNPIDFQGGGQVRDKSTVQLLHRLALSIRDIA